ncbi:MAG: Do family serine endopeptidase [Myxococcales bacterium]|nr:Do family serine endopeptidase [Myxococcales bacterium]
MPGETVSPSSFVTVSSPASLPVQSSVADLADAVSPTVVNITTTDTVDRDDAPGFPGFEFLIPGRPSRRPRARIGAGTGFIIDGGGYVVTNAHVVSDADEVSVRLHDEREFAAEVVGRDAKIDLALLKIGGVTGLPAVTLGDSDTLRVGEHVLAVGNPFGLGHTVTMGIVSAKARSIGAGPYDDFIQTDASINPGNSGGPLFNLRGEVVGINTAIRAGADGIGFAIPVRVLKDIVEQLKQKGYVERGKLGLMFQPITPELASALGQDRPHGALVNDVMPNGPAARAGIQAGDVVVGVGDERLARAEELSRLVARHTPGSSLAVHLVRDGKKLTVHATLDKLEDREHTASRVPKPHAKPARELLPGIEIDDDPEGGVRVVGLTKPAHGLEPGDLIVEALGKPVGTVLELTRALENSTRRAALLKVRRDGKSRYVGVTLTR